MNSRSYLLILAASFAGWTEAGATGDARIGQVLYQAKCASCHSTLYNGVGPAHAGVVGRKAGSVESYTYSQALSKADMVWNEKLLDTWLRNPEKLVPGQKMGVSVPSAKERSDLIAYLKTLKNLPVNTP